MECSYLLIPKFQVWEWINNLIPHFTDHVITDPYWGQS